MMLQLRSVSLASVAFTEHALLRVLRLAVVGACEHELDTEGETYMRPRSSMYEDTYLLVSGAM